MYIIFQLLISLSVLVACLHVTFFEYKTYKHNQKYLRDKDDLVVMQASVLLDHLHKDNDNE
jgi:putative effector of murein hydrolase